MTYRNKGTVATTVVVSRLPDRSGNLTCNGTADNVELQLAIDRVELSGGGSVHVKNTR